jgi:hypothetical protein
MTAFADLVVDHEAVKRISDEVADLKRKKINMEGPLAAAGQKANAARDKGEQLRERGVS